MTRFSGNRCVESQCIHFLAPKCNGENCEHYIQSVKPKVLGLGFRIFYTIMGWLALKSAIGLGLGFFVGIMIFAIPYVIDYLDWVKFRGERRISNFLAFITFSVLFIIGFAGIVDHMEMSVAKSQLQVIHAALSEDTLPSEYGRVSALIDRIQASIKNDLTSLQKGSNAEGIARNLGHSIETMNRVQTIATNKANLTLRFTDGAEDGFEIGALNFWYIVGAVAISFTTYDWAAHKFIRDSTAAAPGNISSLGGI
ncbi:MAG: hypothetical protein K0Q77_1968 [Anaerosporomusa subterranea]|nr:hypothetical protein [Anaerosporomusa subterranea]